MSFDTYANLKTAIGNFITHDDVDAVVDDMIDLAESEFNADTDIAECYDAEERTVHTVPAGETHVYITLPSDWNGARVLRRDCALMEECTPEQMDIFKANNSSLSVSDRFGGYYTIEEQRLRVHPGATENTEIEILYWKKVTALDDTNTSNWLLLLYPALYLYGSLVHAGTFLKGIENIERYDFMYERAKAKLKRRETRKKYPGTARRVRVRK